MGFFYPNIKAATIIIKINQPNIDKDLTNSLPENWRDFNKEFIPIYLKQNPEKSKVAAGLSCGFLWTISKKIKKGDIVLSPDGEGSYFVGEVTDDYQYVPNFYLTH